MRWSMWNTWHLLLSHSTLLISCFLCCLVTHLCLTLCGTMDCMQHSRLPCPSLSLGVCSNSCPLSRWCHPTISSSVTAFSSYPEYFPALGSFTMSRLFASGGHRIGASVSASVLSVSIQGWFPLELTGLISLLSKGLSRVFSSTVRGSTLTETTYPGQAP